MKSVRTSNSNCRTHVQSRKPFTGNNLFAVYLEGRQDLNLTPRYVVYSYGTHWPLFIHQDGVWFENQDRYSVSTSKQKSQAHPHTDTMPMTAQAMRRIAEDGIAGLAVLGEAKY
jgi:hypothetical protein